MKIETTFLGVWFGETIVCVQKGSYFEDLIRTDLTIIPKSFGGPARDASAQEKATFQIFKDVTSLFIHALGNNDDEVNRNIRIFSVPTPYACMTIAPRINVNSQYYVDCIARHPATIAQTSTEEDKEKNKIEFMTNAFQARQYQNDAHLAILKALHSHESGFAGIVIVPPGFGKTIMALQIFAELNVPAMILAHTTVICDQWVERAHTSLKNADILQYGSKEWHKRILLHGNDDWITPNMFCVATLQTITLDRITCESLSRFRLLICDECHHVAARTFSNAIRKFRGMRLSLTATLVRTDKTEKVFTSLIGPVAFEMSEDRTRLEDPNFSLSHYNIVNVQYEPFAANQRIIYFPGTQNMNSGVMSSKIIKETCHFACIITMIKVIRGIDYACKCHQEQQISSAQPDQETCVCVCHQFCDPTKQQQQQNNYLQLLQSSLKLNLDHVARIRGFANCMISSMSDIEKRNGGKYARHLKNGKILVFSETVAHLRLLMKKVIELKICSESECRILVSDVAGKRRDANRKECTSERCRILFSTYQMCREAMDIANLQIAIFASRPIGIPEQTIGRTGRWRAEPNTCPIPTKKNRLDVLCIHLIPTCDPFPRSFESKFGSHYRAKQFTRYNFTC